MPILKPMTIKVRNLRHGDVTDTGAIVDQLDAREKWGYVTFVEQDKPQRILLDLDITIKRPELTDEERELRDRNEALHWLRDTLDEYAKLDPIRGILAAHKKAKDSGYELLPAFAVDQAVHDNALHEVGRQVQRMYDRLVDPEDDWLDDIVTDDDSKLIAAWAVWYLEPTGRSWNSFDRDPLNRSTSVISNIYEDLERWAFFDIQKRMERHSALTYVEAVARTIKERNDARRRGGRR